MHHRIYNVQLSKRFNSINYPLIDLSFDNDITENGIFVPQNFDKTIEKLLKNNSKLLVICNLELSIKAERIKHDNPFLLNVNPLTLQIYKKIDSKFFVKTDDNNIIIKTSVINAIKYEYQEELKNKLEELKKKIFIEEKTLVSQKELIEKRSLI